MDWTALLGGLNGYAEIAKYPDEKVYKAATLLSPEEQPKMPIRALGENHPVWRFHPNADAVTNREAKEIYVNKGKPNYQDPYTLAAMLAHESVHSEGIKDEGPAYRRQLSVAGKLGLGDLYKKNVERMMRRLGGRR